MKIRIVMLVILFNLLAVKSHASAETIFQSGLLWAFSLVALVIVILLVAVYKTSKK